MRLFWLVIDRENEVRALLTPYNEIYMLDFNSRAWRMVDRRLKNDLIIFLIAACMYECP